MVTRGSSIIIILDSTQWIHSLDKSICFKLDCTLGTLKLLGLCRWIEQAGDYCYGAQGLKGSQIITKCINNLRGEVNDKTTKNGNDSSMTESEGVGGQCL